LPLQTPAIHYSEFESAGGWRNLCLCLFANSN
jgi:hypothetical protein